MTTEAEIVERLYKLIRHCWVHSGHVNCGYRSMTTEQRQLYDQIIEAEPEESAASVLTSLPTPQPPGVQEQDDLVEERGGNLVITSWHVNTPPQPPAEAEAGGESERTITDDEWTEIRAKMQAELLDPANEHPAYKEIARLTAEVEKSKEAVVACVEGLKLERFLAKREKESLTAEVERQKPMADFGQMLFDMIQSTCATDLDGPIVDEPLAKVTDAYITAWRKLKRGNESLTESRRTLLEIAERMDARLQRYVGEDNADFAQWKEGQ